MMSRGPLFSLILLLGCAAAEGPVERPKVDRHARIVLPFRPPLPQYVVRLPPRSNASARFELGNGSFGVIARGERWVLDERGSNLKQLDDGLSLGRAQAIGKGAGGGYLFFGPFGLYSAASFDGELVRIAPTVARASAGAGFVMVVFDDGRVRSIDRATGKAGPALPLGTTELATADDGTTVAITHGARALVTRDKGASWTDITKDLSVPTDATVRDGSVWVIDQAGAARVDASGVVRAPLPSDARPAFDAGWTRSESPLEIALARGARASSDRVWVADAGTIFEVSTATGEVAALEKGVLPGNGACEQVSVSDSVLFFCTQSDSAAVFRRPKRGSVTKLERTFGTNGVFLVGAGDAVLFAGPCEGSATKAGIACSRNQEGDWVTLDRSGEIADRPPSEPLRFVGWVPKEDGAYALVAGKGGGLWDAKTGNKTRLEEQEIARLEPLLQTRSTGRTTVSDRLAVVDGVIVGFGSDNVGFKVADGGKRIERSPFRMSSLHNVRGQALGRDSSTGTLWQSSDWGFTFTEVDGPPEGPTIRDDVRACSEGGCTLTQWLRVGWEAVPATAKAPRKPSPQMADEPPLRLIELECSATGAMTRKAIVAADDRMGFGAESHKTGPQATHLGLYPRGGHNGMFGFTEAADLRGAATGKLPAFDGPLPTANVLSQTRRYRWLEPFEAKGTVREGSLRLADLLDASRSIAGGSPDLTALDERGTSVTVLSDPPSVLLVPPAGPLVWLRGKEKPIAFGMPSEGAMVVRSALQTGPEELAVLIDDQNAIAAMRSLGRGRSTEPFVVAPPPTSFTPGPSDALALGTDGKIGLIRLTMQGPPTKEDPALLLRAGEPPSALAPWSTLELDGSAACASMQGFRAVIQTVSPWLSLGGAADPFGRERLSSMRVRWSASLVCLEAVELAFGSHELPNGSQGDSYIAATFGKEPSAGQVMVAEGAELREPRSCKLRNSVGSALTAPRK
jgi:hypothetical protein